MQPWEIGLIIVALLVIGYLLVSSQSEGFSEPIYLDQMAMKYSDPMYFKYSSWERDVDGMSPRDYYLENETNYLNGVAPGYFAGDQLYVDHTDYLNMPPQYRPMVPVGAAAMEMNARKGAGPAEEAKSMNQAATEGFY
jgi:hypothetical protein